MEKSKLEVAYEGFILDWIIGPSSFFSCNTLIRLHAFHGLMKMGVY